MMKKSFASILLFLASYSFCFSQSINKKLEIYSITEYIDGYVINAIDKAKSDTFHIVSIKEKIAGKSAFQKISVGKEYHFELVDLISQSAAMPTQNFVARIKTTIVWKPSDGMKNIPFYSKNTIGLWIKK